MSTVSSREPQAPTREGVSPWRRFSVIAVVQFLVVVDTTVVYVALPTIAKDLRFDPHDLPWVMDAYMIGIGGFLLVGGRVADIIGRKRLMVLGLIVFGLASALAAAAPSPGWLIAGRALQGIGGAMVTPAGMALITDIFPEGPDRYKAFGIFGGIGGVAGASGGLVGGLLTSLSWQYVFLVNIPVVLVVLVLGQKLLPGVRHESSGNADLPGAVLSVVGLTLLLLSAVRVAADHGAWTTTAVVAAVLGVVATVGFIFRLKLAADPLVPRVLYTNRSVMVSNLANAGVGALMFGEMLVVTLYLQNGRGLDPLPASLLILPVSLVIFGGSQLAIKLVGRLGPARVLTTGLLVQAVGLGLWALVLPTADGNVLRYLAPGCVWSLGLGMSIVAAFVVCTAGLHGPIQGVASGLVNTSLQIGGAVGVVVTGLIIGAHAGPEVTGYRLALLVGFGLALVSAAVAAYSGATAPAPAPQAHPAEH